MLTDSNSLNPTMCDGPGDNIVTVKAVRCPHSARKHVAAPFKVVSIVSLSVSLRIRMRQATYLAPRQHPHLAVLPTNRSSALLKSGEVLFAEADVWVVRVRIE